LEDEPLKQDIEEKSDNQPERKITNERKFVQVLRDVNLSINPGDLIGVAGAIGSGKSSLISSILGEVGIQNLLSKLFMSHILKSI
jgi:ABC-type polysaccharide/polyol phosphate transport system ATPase subunit